MDGTILASGGYDGLIKLWRISDGALLRTMVGHTNQIETVAFSPDMKTLASGSDDGVVKLWRVSDGALLLTLTGLSSNIQSAAFSPDGQTLASGGGGWDYNQYTNVGIIELWRVSDGVLLRTFGGLTDYVSSVAFSPNGQTLASGAWDGTITYWRISDGASLYSITSHIVEALVFSPDGHILATAGGDGTVRLWRASDGALQRTLIPQNSGALWSVAFSPDGLSLAATGGDIVTVWRISDGSVLRTIIGKSTGVNSVAFNPDGQSLASDYYSSIKLWQVSDGTQQRLLSGHSSHLHAVAYSPNGSVLASGGSDDTIKIWQVSDGALLRTLIGHTSDINALAFSPDSLTLVSGSSDNTIKIRRVSDGFLHRTLTAQSKVNSVAFSPDGLTIASGDYWANVRLWRVSDGKLLQTLTDQIGFEHSGEVLSVAFSPDNQLLASGSGGEAYVTPHDIHDWGEIYIWRISDGTLLRKLNGHTSWVNSVSFNHDSKILASGSNDNTIRLWRTSDGNLEDSIDARVGTINSVAITPSGDNLAAGGQYGISLWALRYPQPDLQIRTTTESSYTGNNIYNLTGAGQSKAMTVPPNSLATYICKIQNDGSTADTFTITGPAGGGGWMVRYFAKGGTEITAQVTGTGWTTPPLTAGAATTFWASTWCSNTVDGGVPNTLTLTAASTHDLSKNDVNRMVTTPQTSRKSDAMVRASSDAAFLGNDIYSLTGYKQTRSVSIPVGTTATYYFKAQNDGNSADSFTLAGPAGANGWTVKYFAAGQGEITSQVTGAGWSTGVLPRGATTQIWATVKPESSVTPSNAIFTLALTQTSTGDPTKQDLVKAVTTAIIYQPDLWIRTSVESSYTGNEVYTPEGFGQRTAQAVATGATATYLFIVQNDGNAHDAITLTGTAGDSTWAVRYFAAGIGEITAAVTGAGFSTAPLAPSITASFWVTVTPISGATGTKTVLVTAASVANPSKQDVVKAETAVTP